jgi:hypothetical protein
MVTQITSQMSRFAATRCDGARDVAAQRAPQLYGRPSLAASFSNDNPSTASSA